MLLLLGRTLKHLQHNRTVPHAANEEPDTVPTPNPFPSACCSCYSGWFHDVEKLIRKGILEPSGDDHEDIASAVRGKEQSNDTISKQFLVMCHSFVDVRSLA